MPRSLRRPNRSILERQRAVLHLIGPLSAGTLELPELSLAVQTPKGPVVLTGCGHCGVERVVESATASARASSLAAGFHLVAQPDADIESVAISLRQRWKVHAVAPGPLHRRARLPDFAKAVW